MAADPSSLDGDDRWQRASRDPAAIDDRRCRRRPAGDSADRRFRRRRRTAPRSRGHIYGVLRHRGALDWWLARWRRVAPTRGGALLAALVLVEEWSPERDRARLRRRPLPPAAARSRRERRLIDDARRRELGHPRHAAPMRAAIIPHGSAPHLERALGRDLRARDGGAAGRGAARSARQRAEGRSRGGARGAGARQGIDAGAYPLFAARACAFSSACRSVDARRSSRAAPSRCRTKARSSRRCWPMRGPACAWSISAPAPAARPWRWRRR